MNLGWGLSRRYEMMEAKMAKTYTNKSGYRRYKNTGKFVHRANAEKKVGGKIRKGYEVHHKDGNRQNNKPSNLAVLKKAFHRWIHRK